MLSIHSRKYIRCISRKGDFGPIFSEKKCGLYPGKYGTQTYFAAHFIPVFTTIRAFTVRKDVLPSHLLSHLVYQFECRNCDSRYVGRTLQHLSARIKQHVPLHMLPDAAKAKRPKRGRPRKNHSLYHRHNQSKSNTRCRGRVVDH